MDKIFKALDILSQSGENWRNLVHHLYWLSVKLGSFVGLPVVREILFGLVLCCLLFYFFIIKDVSIEWATFGRESKAKKKRAKIIVVFVVPFILTAVFSILRYVNYRLSVSESEIVLADFEDTSNGYKCYSLAQILEGEVRGRLKKYRTLYFDWPHSSFDRSFLRDWIKPPLKVKVVVGGNCISQDDETMVQLDFRVFDTTSIPLNKNLTGVPFVFKGEDGKGFKIVSKVSEVIASAILAIEAAAIECGEKCDTAVTNYVEVYNKIPKTPEYVELARFLAYRASLIYYHLKNYSEAEEMLVSQLSFYPDDFETHITLGDLYAITGQVERAVSIYGEVIQRSPKRVSEVKQNYTVGLIKLDKTSDLDKFFMEYDKQAGAEFWNLKGYAEVKKQNMREAIEHFKHAIVFDTKNLTIAGNIAEAYLQLGKSSDAELFIEKFLTSAGKEPDDSLLVKRGRSRIEQKKASLALMDFSSVRNEFSNPWAKLGKADALIQLGRYDEAKETLQATNQGPGGYAALLYAELYRAQGNCELAIPLYQSVKGALRAEIGLKKCLSSKARNVPSRERL